MKNKLLILLLSFTCIYLSTDTQAQVIKLDSILAVVEEDLVMQSEVDERIDFVLNEYSKSNIPTPSAEEVQKLRETALDTLINENIQQQFAVRLGLKISEDELNQAMVQIAAQNQLSFDDFRRQLVAEGYNYNETRESIRQDMIRERVQRIKASENIEVSNEEIDNFLRSDEADFFAPEFLIGHVLIPISSTKDQKDIANARTLATNAVKRIRNGNDFNQVAKETLGNQRSLNNYSLGWRKISSLPDAFKTQFSKLTNGEVSEPIFTPAGFHILQNQQKKGQAVRIQQEIKARQILILPNKLRGEVESKQLATQLYDELVQDRSKFVIRAREYSDDFTTKYNGGDMGWFLLEDTNLPLQFKQVVALSDEATVAKPFRTSLGWHVVEVQAKRETDLTEDTLQSYAYQVLFEKKFEEQKWLVLKKLRAEAYIEHRKDGEIIIENSNVEEVNASLARSLDKNKKAKGKRKGERRGPPQGGRGSGGK